MVEPASPRRYAGSLAVVGWHRRATRAAGSLPVVLCLLLLGLASTMATQVTAPSPSRNLDPACIRFDDPNAVHNGEIVFTSFTAYTGGLAHAIDAWSPRRGFAIALREVEPAGDEVPAGVNLIYRDVSIPGSAFKGVTATWTHAPATITLNRAELPEPRPTDPVAQQLIQAVVAHETGHALGLGDVPAPGVNIRECANMLMKRSVDKGGGTITVPQPGDIALYCLRWGGAICPASLQPTIAPDPSALPVLAPTYAAEGPATTYRYFVVGCEQPPGVAITPEMVEHGNLLTDPMVACARAPAGVLFHVRFDDGSEIATLTNRRGEFSFQKPDGIAAEVELPEDDAGRFPSLLGFHPLNESERIPADDPACEGGPSNACERVYVLVP